MNSLEVLKQINILSSTILSDFKTVTLKQYIKDSYIPFQKNAKKEINYKHLLGQLKIITGYDFTDKAINTITENDIINFFNLLKSDRDIKQATINRYRLLLNHIFNSAIKDMIIISNPVKYIKRFKEKSRDRALNNIEIKALLQACRQSVNKELYYIVLVALYTGMRYSNIINMKKSNIKGNVYQLDGKETKFGKGQLIYLHQDLMSELNQYIQAHSRDNIFITKRIKRSFKTALLKAGIENFRFHDLRRTFATFLLYNNTNIKTIQNMLGHSSLMMTERYLANDAKKELDAINKLCFI